MDNKDLTLLGLAFAAMTLFVCAWLIGVQGMLGLISNYRAHPERYPDGKGLGRWMAWTLAAGGASFAMCALAAAGGMIPMAALGPWLGITGGLLAGGAVGGLARYRRKLPDGDPHTSSRRSG
jgi:hypothetical protein